MDEKSIANKDKLTKEVIHFARLHQKELKQTEQWIDSTDNIVDAWLLAVNESPRDWRKIIFLEWFFTDEKLYEHEFEFDEFDVRKWCETKEQLHANYARLSSYGTWHTEQHPIYYIVRSALEQGKRAVQSTKVDDLSIDTIPLKNRFRFNSDGQVFFDNIDLRLPTGPNIKVLQKLVERYPDYVPFSKFDSSSVTAASDQLRGYIKQITKSFTSKHIPLKVETKKRRGYALMSLTI